MINRTGIAARIGVATACVVALLATPAAAASPPAGGRLVASIATPIAALRDDRLRLRLGRQRADADRHSPRSTHQRGDRHASPRPIPHRWSASARVRSG